MIWSSRERNRSCSLLSRRSRGRIAKFPRSISSSEKNHGLRFEGILKIDLQGNRPPKAKNRQIRLLERAQSSSLFNSFLNSSRATGLLIDRRRLVTIVPPGLRDAARVARVCRGPAEHVPIGEPVRGLVPVRNPIAAGTDHPVEHPAGRRQARAAIGCDDLVDERIDDWIGNAGKILRALHRGGLRGKITPQRVAGRARKGEPLNREVEVEIIDPFAILYRVNDTQSRLDAQRPEILDERHVMRLKRRLVYQEFDGDWLTLQCHPLAVLDDEAGLLQERAGFAQQRTILT